MKAKLMSQLFIISMLWASYSNSKAETASPAPSSAQAFAAQAGLLAGAASACGQDTSLLTQRVDEVILAIAKSSADKIYAEQTFRSSIVTGKLRQNNNPTFPCTQVIQDFNNLPILRSDYQQTVIAKLGAAESQNQTPAPGNPATPAQANPPAAMPINPLNTLPATANPSQPASANTTAPNPFATPPANSASNTMAPNNPNQPALPPNSTTPNPFAAPSAGTNPNMPNNNGQTNSSVTPSNTNTSANVLNNNFVPQQYVAASPIS